MSARSEEHVSTSQCLLHPQLGVWGWQGGGEGWDSGKQLILPYKAATLLLSKSGHLSSRFWFQALKFCTKVIFFYLYLYFKVRSLLCLSRDLLQARLATESCISQGSIQKTPQGVCVCVRVCHSLI